MRAKFARREWVAQGRPPPLGLPLWDKPLEHESARGLFLRITQLNGYPITVQAEREAGLRINQLARGESLVQLAKLVKCHISQIEQNTFLNPVGRAATIRTHKLSPMRDYRWGERLACPVCLAHSPHHRFWWEYTFIGACPLHDCRLVGACNCKLGTNLGWSTAKITSCGQCEDGDISREDGMCAHPDTIRMSRYFLGRLGIGRSPAVPVLDEHSLAGAVDIVSRVGSLTVDGFSLQYKTARDCRGLSYSDVLGRGFGVLADHKIQEILGNVFDEYRKSRDFRPLVFSRGYGWFFPWLIYMGGERYSKEMMQSVVDHAHRVFLLITGSKDDTSGNQLV